PHAGCWGQSHGALGTAQTGRLRPGQPAGPGKHYRSGSDGLVGAFRTWFGSLSHTIGFDMVCYPPSLAAVSRRFMHRNTARMIWPRSIPSSPLGYSCSITWATWAAVAVTSPRAWTPATISAC